MIPVYRTSSAPMRQLPLVGVDAEFQRFLANRPRPPVSPKDAKP